MGIVKGTLKITADKSITNVEAFVGLACKMEYILNSHIEISVGCPMGWTMAELPKILAMSFTEEPKAVHLMSIKYDESILN